jgi:hypothetical protein
MSDKYWEEQEKEIEERQRIIGQNGNTGDHYVNDLTGSTRVFGTVGIPNYAFREVDLVNNHYNFLMNKDGQLVSPNFGPEVKIKDCTKTEEVSLDMEQVKDLFNKQENSFINLEYLERAIEGTPERSTDQIMEGKFKTISDSIASLLKYKNLKYGNAALEPLNIFKGKCKVGTRLDDKLARVKNGEDLQKNDVSDLIGYLILTCVEMGWENFDEFKD